MSKNLTIVDSFGTIVTVPEDGDGATGGTVELQAQQIVNRTENNHVRLNDNDTLLATAARFPRSNTATELVNLTSGGTDTGVVGWLYVPNSGAGAPHAWEQQATSSFSSIDWDITQLIPAGGSTAFLDNVTIHLAGGAGVAGTHTSIAGMTKPTLSVNRVALDGTGTTTEDSLLDQSADAAAYDPSHTIVLSSISHTILANQRYYVKITGETGPNSKPNALVVYTITVGWVYP